jgi:serine/threonine-protein kinase
VDFDASTPFPPASSTSAAGATTLEPGTIVGEYRVESKLGEGGMASVFGAIHPLIGKKAAIKVMSPSLSLDRAAEARFVLEAQAVNRIGHPNIVDVFNFGRLPDGRSYFVMEWLQGETLFDRMWRQLPLPLPDVVHILDQICDALEAAHDEGIVHRDLKPANVFLAQVRGKREQVKLLDFGVAKLVRPDAPSHTSRDCVLGTPEYIAPEQARGRSVDTRADLYSLGVIAYEMVLGRLPFLSDNPADAIQMNLTATPPRPSILWSDIPPSLERVLLGLLAKEPAERATLPELRAVLAELRHAMPTEPLLERIEDAPPPRTMRRSRLLVRLAAVAVSFVALVLFGYRPLRPLGAKPEATRALASESKLAAQHSGGPSGAAVPSLSASPPTARPQPLRRARKHPRDLNYLLDPFPRP